MYFFSNFFLAAGLLQSVFSSPTLDHIPALEAALLDARQTSNLSAMASLSRLAKIITDTDPNACGLLGSLVPGVSGGRGNDLDRGNQIFSSLLATIEDTVAAQATATPTSIPAATSALSKLLSAAPTILYEQVFQRIKGGLITSNLTNEVNALATASFSGMNSDTSVNPAPKCTIYPQKNCTDAPYTLTEEQLRQVIYIPSTFTYGRVPPVILVPGTGNTGYQTFAGNYIPLLQGSTVADPVWLNIPDQLLMDVQVNAEYVAYALNYITCITNTNVSVISWSQGGLDTQWALKYWPSTRQVTSNLIAHAPDFHGTKLAFAVCPGYPLLPCPPAIIQQDYNSRLIAKIRDNGGDSAYIPTTTIFSSNDEVVQPMSPVTGASAFLLDARNIGVTNSQVQAICGGRGPAGTFYTHEGVLYNPLGYALTIDALTNSGPGQTSRINLETVCRQTVSPGLDLSSVLKTEEAVVIAVLSIVRNPAKQFREPAIMGYASDGATVNANCTISSNSRFISTDSISPSTNSSSASTNSTTSVMEVSPIDLARPHAHKRVDHASHGNTGDGFDASSIADSSAPATTDVPQDVYSSTGDKVNPDGSYEIPNNSASKSCAMKYVTATVWE